MTIPSLRILVDHTRGLRFTESPRWWADRLWFLDIHGLAIKSVDLQGRLETVLDLPFKPNGFGRRQDGSLVFGDSRRFQVHRWGGGELQHLSDLSGLIKFRLSDGIVDAEDRFYVGDIGYDFLDPAAKPANHCVIVCVEPDGKARVVADDLCFPNGMVISPDGRTLIVAECMAHRLSAFDILADGSLGRKRLFAELPEEAHPDGIALDAEGAVWVASPAGEVAVYRLREGGEVVERIRLDTKAYAVMLGGPEGRHLFICASDSHDPDRIAMAPSATLRVTEVEVPGAAEPVPPRSR